MPIHISSISAGSTVTINDRTYSGRDISVVDGRVIVDGKEQDPAALGTGPVTVNVHGNCERVLLVTGTIHVDGDVGKVDTQHGNVRVDGNVAGDVNSLSGNVHCGEVRGRGLTMSGSVSHRGGA